MRDITIKKQTFLLFIFIAAIFWMNKAELEILKAPPASFNEAVVKSAASLTASVGVEAENNFMPVIKTKINPPFLNAAAVLAIDLENGFEFFSRNTHKRWPAASLVKLMTAVVAKEKINRDQTIIINETALAAEGESGNFKKDELYSAEDLIKIMLVVSSNDAAVALADFFNADNFIKAMNEKASELGLRETNFYDSTGLSILNQSTLMDLRKLVYYIINNYPDILEITAQPVIAVKELSLGGEKKIRNINEFAGSQTDFIGGKTGYTDEARQNLVSVFHLNKKPLLIAVFGSEDRFGETLKILKWIKEAYNRY